MAIIELVQQKLVSTEAEAARKTKFAKDEKPAAEVVDQDADAPESATKDAADEPAEGAVEVDGEPSAEDVKAEEAKDKKDES
jgi:large subunit ribosomal protein L17